MTDGVLESGVGASAAAPRKRPSKLRSGTAWVLLVLFCIMAPLALVAGWAKYSLLDTNHFEALVAPIATNQHMRDAIAKDVGVAAAKLTEKANDRVASAGDELVAAVRERIFGKAAAMLPAATPIAELGSEVKVGGITIPLGFNEEAIRARAEAATQKAMQSPKFSAAWNDAMRLIQKRLLATEDTTGPLELNLVPFLPQIQQDLADSGIPLLAKIRIPGEKLRIQLMDEADADALRAVLRTVSVLGLALPVAALALFLAVVAVAPGRWGWVRRLGMGLTISMIVLLVVLLVGQRILLGQIPKPNSRAVADALLEVMLNLPVLLALGIAVVGAVIAIAATAINARRLRAA